LPLPLASIYGSARATQGIGSADLEGEEGGGKREIARSSRSCRWTVNAAELEEMDVESILAFAERVLPSASNLWVQSSLNQKQRLQQLFFPDGVRFDGTRLLEPR